MQSSERRSSPALLLFPSGVLQQLVGARVRPARLPPALAKASIVVLAWLPLVILSAIERSLFSSAIPFARDFAVHVRLLVELPTLLAAAVAVQSLVRRAVDYLFDAGLVREECRVAFRGLVSSTGRANRSRVVAAAVLVLAVLASFSEMSGWVEIAAGTTESSWRVRDGHITTAGFWFVLVARPILYAQFGLWLFRFALWTRFLFRASRMIRPIAAHPDGMGGLGPLNPAHTGFAVLAFVVGADLAAGLANRLVHLGSTIAAYHYVMVAIIVATVTVLLSPMLCFFPGLYRAQVAATFSFGSASVVEAREIDARIGRAAREEPFTNIVEAFTAYLHTSESMRRLRSLALVPLYRRTVMMFLLAVAVPFVVAALAQFSVPELLRRIHDLLELDPVATE